MSSVVEILEGELIALFEDLANRVKDQFPNVSARVYSHPVGQATDYQGHSIGVDCLLHDAPEPDNITLQVCLVHLTTEPKISADVCWGHPSGRVEAEFLSEPVDVSDEVVKNLYSDLPRLSENLVEAVQRGRP